VCRVKKFIHCGSFFARHVKKIRDMPPRNN